MNAARIGGATLLAKSLRRPIILLIVALAIGVACRHAAVSTTSPRSTLPPGFTARDVAVGDSLFNARSCRRCHGLGGKGTVNGPTFLSGTWRHGNGTIADIARTIVSGVPLDSIKDSTFKLDMHPNPSDFSPSQIQSVAAYVWTLSRARIVKPPAP